MLNKKKTGFTLLEMIITLSITVIVLGIASSVFITGNKVFSDSNVKSTLQMEAQGVQEKISDICMEASKVQISDTEINAISYDEHDTKQKKVITNENRKLLIIIYDDKDIEISRQSLSEGLVESLKFEYTENLVNVSIKLKESKNINPYIVNFSVTLRNRR